MLRDNLGIGKAEPHLFRKLVEAGLGDHFTEHLTVKAERAGLVGRQRMTEAGGRSVASDRCRFAGN